MCDTGDEEFGVRCFCGVDIVGVPYLVIIGPQYLFTSRNGDGVVFNRSFVAGRGLGQVICSFIPP